MFISIVIPTFNSENTLSNTLKSICEQTFKSIEILIIDNCSTDNTLRIVADYQELYKTIIFQIHSDADKGIYDAMNKGISLAQGDWIYFLGSDDTLYNNDVLEKIYQFTNSKSLDVIYGNVTSELFGGVYAGEFDYPMLMHKNICHQAIFFKKTVFKKIGNFKSKYPINADWEHNLRWFFNRRIKNQYIELIICNYGMMGISSKKKDEVFKTEKEKIILKYCWTEMELTEIILNCKQILYKYLKKLV